MASELLVGWNSMSAIASGSVLVHTCRAGSVLRKMPTAVAASRIWPFLEMARRLTCWKLGPVVDGICSQCTPSTVRKRPAPRSASRLEKPSPVPA
jgi:hypothetical protein